MASEEQTVQVAIPRWRANDRLPNIALLNEQYRQLSDQRHARRAAARHEAVLQQTLEQRLTAVSEALDDYIAEAQATGRSSDSIRHTALACFLCAAL